MINNKKVVAFLPAKGSSERIPSKNQKKLAGKPLFLHTIEKLMLCEFIDEVYLDTESEEMIQQAQYTGCKTMLRDKALATNATDGHQLFFNEAKFAQGDIYIHILGTSPFIKPETIKRGVEALLENEAYDSVVLLKKDKLYFWEDGEPTYDRNSIPNSKDLPELTIESMGLYIVRNETAFKYKMRFGYNVFPLYADAIEYIDVNNPDEFELAELIMQGIKIKEIQKLNAFCAQINSALLSDIMDEFEGNFAIRGLNINLPDKKVFGRARTLHLRELEKDEDYHGIYKALETYENLVLNDVIVVQNDCGEFAYFGERNSELAVRAGVSGVIVDGVTRDSKEVIKNGLPVLARGYFCKDVKGRATVKNYDEVIEIGSVAIAPFDLIFADCDGVVVIPKKYEAIVFEKIRKAIEMEKNVSNGIASDLNATDIASSIGYF